MSGKTQFWLGSLMLAAAIGIMVGGLLHPRPSYSQNMGEGRSGNFAVVSTDLKGLRPSSGVVYVLDDRNEVLYVLECSARKGVEAELVDVVDFRKLGTKMQKRRAEEEARMGKGIRP